MELDVKFNTWDICIYPDRRKLAAIFFSNHSYEVSFLTEWPDDQELLKLHEAKAREFFNQTFTFEIEDLLKSGIPFECRNTASSEKESHYLIRLNGKIDQALKLAKASNNIQNMHIQGFAEEGWIHRVNEVVIAEDFCTDELQEKLNEGFRIISAIMMKGNRRPDYVLGRIKSKVI